MRVAAALLAPSWNARTFTLVKWALAFHLMAASKNGFSAHQLMRMLGLGTYRTAWFMVHRIREAMKEDVASSGPLGGEGKTVIAD